MKLERKMDPKSWPMNNPDFLFFHPFLNEDSFIILIIVKW